MTHRCRLEVSSQAHDVTSLLFSWSAMLLLTACVEQTDASGKHFAGRDSAGIRIIAHPAEELEKVAPFRLVNAPTLRIGARDGPSELQFSRITHAVRTSAGTIVVLDRGNREVMVFDGAGRFLHRIGAHGRGPGEFQDPAALVRDEGDTILVWDAALRRVSRFRLAGPFLESLELSASGLVALGAARGRTTVAVLDETPRMPAPPEGDRVQNAGRLVRLGSDRELMTVATFAGTEWETRRSARGIEIQRPWYLPRLLAAISEERTWVTRGTTWELIRYDNTEGNVDRVIRFRASPERFTTARIHEMNAAELTAVASEATRDAVARRQQQEQYPETIPPIEDLRVDAAGRIWVGRLEAPPSSLPSGMGRATTSWVVLDRDGERVLGTLSIPPRRRLLHADGDGVLVVTVDADDVPYLEWWSYER